jgi:hypothetical protein
MHNSPSVFNGTTCFVIGSTILLSEKGTPAPMSYLF